MDKRGIAEEESIFTAFEIIAIVLVFGVFAFVTTNFDAVSRASEIYAEEDLNLLANTIEASPGKITYNYPIKDIYRIEQQENKINVIRDVGDFPDYYNYYNLTLSKEETFRIT